MTQEVTEIRDPATVDARPICPPCAEVGDAINAVLRQPGDGAPRNAKELAELLGMDRGQLSLRLRGLQHLRACEVADIAWALGVPVGALIGDESVAPERALRVLESVVAGGRQRRVLGRPSLGS